MPSRPTPFWWLTVMLLVAFPVLNFIYWPEVLQSGVLPPDGDSIGIAMYGSVIAAIIFSPIVLGVTWLCLRRYNPTTNLWTWRRDRPLRTIVVSTLFGASLIAVAVVILESFQFQQPWYEYLWTVYFSFWLWWLLGMRAAAIDQLSSPA